MKGHRDKENRNGCGGTIDEVRRETKQSKGRVAGKDGVGTGVM